MSGQSAHNKTECDIAWYLTFKVDIYHIDIYLIPTGIYHWMVYTKTPNHMVYTMVYIKKRCDIQWYITHCISHGISHSVLTCCGDVVYHCCVWYIPWYISCVLHIPWYIPWYLAFWPVVGMWYITVFYGIYRFFPWYTGSTLGIYLYLPVHITVPYHKGVLYQC